MFEELKSIHWDGALLVGIVTGLITVIAQRLERRSSNKATKQEARERERRALYSLIKEFESFAMICSRQYEKIEEAAALSDAYHNHANYDSISKIEFKLPDTIDWHALKTEDIAIFKDFASRFDARNEWVKSIWSIGNSDLDDAYYFESQRIVYYGNEAYKLARVTRKRINVAETDLDDTLEWMDAWIENAKSKYAKQPSKLIPELHSMDTDD